MYLQLAYHTGVKILIWIIYQVEYEFVVLAIAVSVCVQFALWSFGVVTYSLSLALDVESDST